MQPTHRRKTETSILPMRRSGKQQLFVNYKQDKQCYSYAQPYRDCCTLQVSGVLCSMVQCVVVWCGVVWCGLLSCGVAWRGMAWCLLIMKIIQILPHSPPTGVSILRQDSCVYRILASFLFTKVGFQCVPSSSSSS